VATVSSAAWWIPLRDETIRMVQMNSSARLSERPTMAFWALFWPLSLLEMSAKDESQHVVLLASGVADALEYACANDFAFMGMSVAATGAGALVALVGRAEGGKTLSRKAVFAVLKCVQNSYDEDHIFHGLPLPAQVSYHVRVATMAISDTNKRTMLELDGLLDFLVKSLLLASPRRGEVGADGIQEASAEILAQLALFGPGAEMMRLHSGVMAAIHALRDGESSTEKSQQSAVQVLFQLEDRPQSASSSASGTQPKHVMMSYNWDHQPTIKRIHAALVSRGYTVWIDVEQMKGSTVDAMSLAVEDAAVVVFGVSRAYKESTNCRLEAQYAMQREVDTVPLMLVDGYRPDGWLGMLMGTRLWYSFYGGTLTDMGLFEGKVEELCRELGERGRGGDDGPAALGERGRDHVTAAGSDGGGRGSAQHEQQVQQLEEAACQHGQQLSTQTNKALWARAALAGATAAQLEAAADSEDVKGALARLVVALEPPPPAARREELAALSNKDLRRQARTLVPAHSLITITALRPSVGSTQIITAVVAERPMVSLSRPLTTDPGMS
jgi:hypothetical protein